MDKDKPRNSEERNKLIKEELNNPEGFIWSVIKKKGYGNAIESWNFMDKDDLIQEGWIALLQAGDNYDKGFNKDFAWYAFYWVNQRLGRIVDENIDKERHETSWEKNYEIEDKKEPATRFDEFIDELSQAEQDIIRMTIEGYTQKEIAMEVGIDQSNISRKLEKIRNYA